MLSNTSIPSFVSARRALRHNSPVSVDHEDCRTRKKNESSLDVAVDLGRRMLLLHTPVSHRMVTSDATVFTCLMTPAVRASGTPAAQNESAPIASVAPVMRAMPASAAGIGPGPKGKQDRLKVILFL